MSSPVSESEKTPLAAAPGPGSARSADPEPGERVSRKLFLVLLAALGIFVIAVYAQSRRIEGFQAQIGGLEGQVAELSSALEDSRAQVSRFELEREQIRLSVDTLREDLLALAALVGPAPSSAPAEP